MQFGGIWGGALRERASGLDRWLGLVLALALVLLVLGLFLPAIKISTFIFISREFSLVESVFSFLEAGNYFLFAVTFAGIGAATTSAREAGPITAIVTLPAVIPVYLSSVLLSDPDGGLARTLSFIPLTAPTTMIQRIGSGGVSTVEMLGSLVLTAAVAGAMLFVSARVFRAGLLMYGQRMTLPAVWRAVRQAT